MVVLFCSVLATDLGLWGSGLRASSLGVFGLLIGSLGLEDNSGHSTSDRYCVSGYVLRDGKPLNPER